MRSGYKASNHRHRDVDMRDQLYRLDMKLEAETEDEAKNLAGAWWVLQEVMFGERRKSGAPVRLAGITLNVEEGKSGTIVPTAEGS